MRHLSKARNTLQAARKHRLNFDGARHLRFPLAALALCGILVIQGAYIGPQPAVFSELFPTATRYSGASLSLTLGTILGGALSPVIAAALFGATGNSSLITVYITAMAFIAWLCTLGLKETYRDDLSR